MHIIVGLGNPGKKHEHTRHNAGFLGIDHFLDGREGVTCQQKFKGHLCEMKFTAANLSTGPVRAMFLKPQTYMNNSGEAVSEALRFYKIKPETHLLVIHDEIDLKFGYVKPAFDSGPAGHNGVKSIIQHLGTQEFSRIRIGVESRLSRTEKPTDAFVLEIFTPEEKEKLTSVFTKTDELIAAFLVTGSVMPSS